jgi:UDP-2,3-diacylglucosamine pyrophosphatase LpxH
MDYYFISDLHIGGEGQLRHCDFMDELISFLKELEQHQGEAELIINGDAFGLWEFTSVEGPDKLDALIHQQSRLFDQLKATGAHVQITLLPGNHDYELACYPEFVDRLKEFNVDLVPKPAITREIAGHTVWIEHGMQHDENNHIPDFGNPHAQPVGYHISTRTVGTAGRVSDFGRDNWLKDLQSVVPMTDIPSWMISNYFYKEMGAPLRYVLLPFLLLFGVSTVVFAAGVLEEVGAVTFNIVIDTFLFESLGVVGDALTLIFAVNAVVLGFLLLFAVPASFLVRDVRATLNRYNLLERDEAGNPVQEGKASYLRAARQVFDDHPEVSVFVFGHTHDAFLRTLDDGRVVLNTGTWLKLLHKIPVLVGYLPPVYYPTYQISTFRATEEDGELVIYYRQIPKSSPDELTFLQRLLISFRQKPQPADIPERTVVGASTPIEAPESMS